MAASGETPEDALNLERSPAKKPGEGASVLLTTAEAREVIKQRTGHTVLPRTLLYWLERGQLYAVRVGRKLLIPRFVIEEFCEQCLRGEKMQF